MRNRKLIVFFAVLCAVTLLVVFNSVLFSVRHVRAYCENVQNSVLADKVLSTHKIKRTENIFFVNKKKVAERVESGVPGVRVLNVEKKFPNRIYINYVEVKPYLRLLCDGNSYFCANDLRVMYVESGDRPLWSSALEDPFWQDVPTENRHVIDLKLTGGVETPSVGNLLRLTDATEGALVTGVFAALERLGYYESVIELFSQIEVLGRNSPILALQTTTGMRWEVGSADNLTGKLRLALSVYRSDKLSDDQRKTGTLKIAADDRVSYVPGDGSAAVEMR